MKIGFVGLGKMGANMVERLLLDGHDVVAHNRSMEAVRAIAEKGALAAESFEDLTGQLTGRKAVWLMVPSGDPVEQNLDRLIPLLSADDIIVDGGNSHWRDSKRRAARLAEYGLRFIDCGTSGGIWGLKNGYCLMYGGDRGACEFLRPVFKTLAPPEGHLHCGSSGAGHFVKMVHNGIEYGIMQAYAEGFELMERSGFDLDLLAVSRVWQQGSVIRSWLLDLAERAFSADPKLSEISGRVADSGEGRWTVQAAVDFGVSAPVITASLFQRFQSRQDNGFGNRLLAALRGQFGGHAVETRK
ncbi:MAG: phosphogluconate dehydrogenase (NAD(+)-dependent, decarboxylating) [Nitrospinaceae bacterium]